jgi:hypothetical protein
MAAPSGKYKKYVALITGLVLLLLMIKPLQHFTGQGLPVTDWFSGITSVPAADSGAEYEQWSRSQISAAFEEQLYAQVDAILAQEGYTLKEAVFEYEDDFSQVTRMDLTVYAGPEVKKQSKPLIRIEPVKIPFGGEAPSEKTEPESEDALRIKKLITDFYSPDVPHINVSTTLH